MAITSSAETQNKALTVLPTFSSFSFSASAFPPLPELSHRQELRAASRGSGRRTGFLHFLALAVLALLPCLGWSAAGISAAEDARQHIAEYDLKAVYLYNFLHFAQWPEGEPRASGPDVIAVLGDSPIGRSLDALRDKLAASGKTAIEIRMLGHYHAGMDLSGCRLLFVSDSEKAHFQAITGSLGATPVLTVAEDEDFLDAGGMVALTSHANKVRWSVNRLAVQRAGLRMSAKLLDMALAVRE